ncbi:biopolymer transporter ExbD [Maricaulaceae bacterium EIL42A08]|nr:biopolymer transporter ExbD [Maricaulaceae bacterium EIL42A08]MCP2678215.1 biopolymer transporter ExbD [Maricaulaceae bacterium NA33B04]
MRRRTRRGNDQADVNMTPMLDIVFILLIFFIVTATFLTEVGEDLRPPPDSDEPPPPNAPPPIIVQIDAQNNVFVNGESTSALRVTAAVSRIRAESPESAVVITPNDEAEHGLVVEMLDDLRQNSIAVIISRDTSE